MESPKIATSNPPRDIGVNWQQQQQPSCAPDVGEKTGERHQHKSLLITKSPSNLTGHRSNKASSESDFFYHPPIIQGKSHDLQLDCNPLLQEVALGLSQLASVLRGPEAEKDVNTAKVRTCTLSNLTRAGDGAQISTLCHLARIGVVMINQSADAYS